jgi:hypothetical protein
VASLKYSTGLLVVLSSMTAVSTPALAQPTPDTIASVCTGVSLPPSVVTGIMDPVLTGIVTPVESTVNDSLDVIAVIPIVGTVIPDLDVDLTTLLSDAAAGDPITLSAIAKDALSSGPRPARCSCTTSTPERRPLTRSTWRSCSKSRR